MGRAVGAALAGEVTDILFLLHGLGANGKSTLLRVVLELLGDYAVRTWLWVAAKQTEPELLLARRGEVHPNSLSDLTHTTKDALASDRPRLLEVTPRRLADSSPAADAA